ncbi:hypothetical protein PIB30_052322 [Stylosanthes scabra]|uniref:Uncharacterized protein n=1 Tax=Stylosanthes scabra TaxID=79078 RepID=A0ABU6VID1_9FABA|nr:hypothetical protein [Stylosanthes scabra]
MEESESPSPSPSSSRRSKKAELSNEANATGNGGSFGSVNDDLLQNILARLPARSFASAACVSKSWSSVCNRILTRPKLSSALSLNPSLSDAVDEVLQKVLCEPIRPHFAIVNVGSGFDLEKIMHLSIMQIGKTLGSNIPVIVTVPNGIIGRDALTDEFKEVKWGALFSGFEGESYARNVNEGIVLTVGYLPGLKVEAIPLRRPTPTRRPSTQCVDDFIKDIKEYSASVSNYPFPVGIILFGEANADMNSVMEKLDCALPRDTVIAGDERGCFMYRSGNAKRNLSVNLDAIALVFAQDRDGSSGTITFHVALSNGVSPVGTTYKAASVRTSSTDCSTWLTAKREGQQEVLDGQSILDDVNNLLENHIASPDLYIGVIKNRKVSVEGEKPTPRSCLSYHGVVGKGHFVLDRGDEEYLYVDGTGVRTGDIFQFYYCDPNAAQASVAKVHDTLKNIKLKGEGNNSCVFGGLIFACYGRGESFFARHNVDSYPLLECFPGLPVAGVFCGGEIVRPFTTMSSQEGSRVNCCLHVYSSVYLVMSYTPPSVEC